MSLLGSIQQANNALITTQLGLEVTGNNIANANTPGYLRESLVVQPADTYRKGDLLLGLGVQVQAVVQHVDLYLESRLRAANADVASGRAQENAYSQLEALIGELSDVDLSTSLSEFFGSINDVLNQPESVSVRNLAVLQGQNLTSDLQRLDRQVRELHSDANRRIGAAADEINRLTAEIAKLNVQIVTTEGGNTTNSDAVGLRDQRLTKLSELGELIDIRADEQNDGSVSVSIGGALIVFSGTAQQVEAKPLGTGDTDQLEIRFVKTDSPLRLQSGEVAGLTAARDRVLGGFLEDLDELSRTLIYEFNRVFSSGQGLTGFDELTSEFTVSDADAALDAAGLSFTPSHGSFQVLVRDRESGLTETHDIRVQLEGLDDDLTLRGLAETLDAVDGLTAELTPTRGLRLGTEGSNLEFSFANDTSGVLAALGLNTFFKGDSATTVGVNEVLAADPSKFAASGGGIGADATNAEALAQFLDRPLESLGGDSLAILYDRVLGETSKGAALARSTSEGYRVFQQTLQGEKLAFSGVNIDEEVINMISYQRAFQASARFISTISDLLEVLVNL